MSIERGFVEAVSHHWAPTEHAPHPCLFVTEDKQLSEVAGELRVYDNIGRVEWIASYRIVDRRKKVPLIEITVHDHSEEITFQ